ncbi:uncharacterized protein PG998_001058 [Apiospora kogelbergensis]|uniref:Secreted protein n=1 Tax=Apiospora kogelbergensis TaxID=1337665 RepID=A0AAW0QRP1_9PEZI
MKNGSAWVGPLRFRAMFASLTLADFGGFIALQWDGPQLNGLLWGYKATSSTPGRSKTPHPRFGLSPPGLVTHNSGCHGGERGAVVKTLQTLSANGI